MRVTGKHRGAGGYVVVGAGGHKYGGGKGKDGGGSGPGKGRGIRVTEGT